MWNIIKAEKKRNIVAINFDKSFITHFFLSQVNKVNSKLKFSLNNSLNKEKKS